jgi:hypothetical protein
MAVLAPMKNTTPIDGFIGDGDFSNEQDIMRPEPSFGLKFGFLKNGKRGSVFTV